MELGGELTGPFSLVAWSVESTGLNGAGQQQDEGDRGRRMAFALWSRCPKSKVDFGRKRGTGKETGAGC